jgi:hypothetical protein
MHIYKLISKKSWVYSNFDIDFQKSHIFIVTKIGVIRVYSF